MNKIWYAVLNNKYDNDWGYGDYDRNKACEMAMSLSEESVVGIISQDDMGGLLVDYIEHDELLENF